MIILKIVGILVVIAVLALVTGMFKARKEKPIVFEPVEKIKVAPKKVATKTTTKKTTAKKTTKPAAKKTVKKTSKK